MRPKNSEFRHSLFSPPFKPKPHGVAIITIRNNITNIPIKSLLVSLFIHILVDEGGVEPPSDAYKTPALTVELLIFVDINAEALVFAFLFHQELG